MLCQMDAYSNFLTKKDGTGIKYGVVPQVVSTDKNESNGEKKGPNMTINPTSDLYPNYDLNLNCIVLLLTLEG